MFIWKGRHWLRIVSKVKTGGSEGKLADWIQHWLIGSVEGCSLWLGVCDLAHLWKRCCCFYCLWYILSSWMWGIVSLVMEWNWCLVNGKEGCLRLQQDMASWVEYWQTEFNPIKYKVKHFWKSHRARAFVVHGRCAGMLMNRGPLEFWSIVHWKWHDDEC